MPDPKNVSCHPGGHWNPGRGATPNLYNVFFWVQMVRVSDARSGAVPRRGTAPFVASAMRRALDLRAIALKSLGPKSGSMVSKKGQINK